MNAFRLDKKKLKSQFFWNCLVLVNNKVGTLSRRFLVNIGWFLFDILTWNKNRFDDNMSSDGWFAVSYNYLEQKHGELWYKINELDDVKAVIVFFWPRVLISRSYVKHFLALLLFKSVFKEHENWLLTLAINILVLAHTDHGIRVHRFTWNQNKYSLMSL